MAETAVQSRAAQSGGTPLRSMVVDRVWSVFTSPSVALLLILSIAVAGLFGTLLRQAPSGIVGSADAYRTWVERIRPEYGALTDLLDTLGLFTVFDSVWFRGLLGALAVSIVVCTLDRLPAVWHEVTAMAPRPADALFDRGHPRATLSLAKSPAQAAVLVREALRSRRYRTAVESADGASYCIADRDRFARFGTLFTHGSLVLVLLVPVLSGPLGFFQDSEFAVPVGSIRDIGHGTSLALGVEDFADEYYADGRPKDYRTEAVLFSDGKEVGRQTIRVNEPLVWGDVRIHQAFFGQAALVRVTGKQDTLFDDAVALAWRSTDGTRPVGYFYLEAADLHVYLVGTAGATDRLILPGQLVVEAYRGNARVPTYRVPLIQGKPAAVADMQFVFERELQFTGLFVTRDPGAALLWVASILLLVGIGLAFYFPHRRVWARVRRGEHGSEVVLVGSGRASGDEIAHLVRRLERAGFARRSQVAD